MGYVCANFHISTIFGFCGSVWRLICYFLAFFCKFCQNYTTFPRNRSAHIILVLDATFLPNFTFLGLLSPEIPFGEKAVTHTDTQLTTPSANLSAEHWEITAAYIYDAMSYEIININDVMLKNFRKVYCLWGMNVGEGDDCVGKLQKWEELD